MRQFNAFAQTLPPRVEELEDYRIGTPSGNPTSDVIYGFKEALIDKVPRFALASQWVTRDEGRGYLFDRHVNVMGAVNESTFEELYERLRADSSDWWIIEREMTDISWVRTRVRETETTEKVIGELLVPIFSRTRIL